MRTKNRPKIKDVAKLAGVSPALVSLALNEKPSVIDQILLLAALRKRKQAF